MTEVAVAPAQAPVRERSGLLTLGGIVLLLMAAMMLLLVPFILLAVLFEPSAGGPAGMRGLGMTLSTALSYVALAVFLGALGAGSLGARRWVPPLVMATSWIWLLLGVVMVVVVYQTLPQALRDAAATQQEELPAGLLAVMAALTVTLLAVLGIALPVFLLLLYRSAGVRAALQRRTPQPSRLEGVPMPVLTLSLIFVFAAWSQLTFALWLPAMPLFGFVVTGLPALVLQLVLAAVSAWLAYAVFRRSMAGWLGTVAITVFYGASMVLSGTAGMAETYRAMGLSEGEVAEIMNMPMVRDAGLWYGAVFVLLAGYMMYVRRYFAGKPG